MRTVRALELCVLAALASSGALACRDASRRSPEGTTEAVDDAGPAAAAMPVAEQMLLDAGARGPASPFAGTAADAAPAAACSGAELSFEVAVVDARCAITSRRARELRALLEHDGGPPLPLRQEASVASDGRLVLRLVATGTSPLVLPLSYASKLPAFSVLAEDEEHTLFELESPRFDVAVEAGTGGAASERPHFARIALAAGASIRATLGIGTSVVRVVARGAGAVACDGGAPCAPARLPKGRYVLYVGQLLTDVEAGAPARVPFDVP